MVRHRTFNPVYAGSNPTGLTRKEVRMANFRVVPYRIGDKDTCDYQDGDSGFPCGLLDWETCYCRFYKESLKSKDEEKEVFFRCSKCVNEDGIHEVAMKKSL